MTGVYCGSVDRLGFPREPAGERKERKRFEGNDSARASHPDELMARETGWDAPPDLRPI
jgi:hypothetical protein